MDVVAIGTAGAALFAAMWAIHVRDIALLRDEIVQAKGVADKAIDAAKAAIDAEFKCLNERLDRLEKRP